MAKSNRDIPKKKRGPPSQGGRKPPQLVRMDDVLTSAIDHWRGKQSDELSRPEAIRRLVELGLTVRATKPKQAPATRADRAKELASKAIDKLTGGASDDDEKARRKRRLIKGPEEFLEVRVDRPKAKGSPK
jgi:hypothetical protein